MSHTSIKVFDGFSCCFRQWKAEGTHCKFLHGYAISFKVTFSGELDERNWVLDFGAFKRAVGVIPFDGKNYAAGDFFNWFFDHTVIVASDDPELEMFKNLALEGVIKLRILPQVGCEKFAEFIYLILEDFLEKETKSRVKVQRVEVMENQKNSATYERTEYNKSTN